MATRTKLIIIGIDSISRSLLDQFVKRGYVPTIERLIREGCYTEGRSFCPVETGTNWAVLSTGASPAITGCNMGLHLPGMPLNATIRGFPSDLCRAEQIWNAARRGGKRSVIFDYPQSYPVNCPDAIHVGEDGRPGQALRALQEMHGYRTHPAELSAENLRGFVTGIAFSPATDWANVPESSPSALAAELPIEPGRASNFGTVSSLQALLLPAGEDGEPALAICGTRDGSAELARLRAGEWSEPVGHDFETDQGRVNATFRAKLFEASADGARVHLYLTTIYQTRGFAHPEDIEERLFSVCGPYYPHTLRQQPIQAGAADIRTFLEEVDFTVGWYRGAMEEVLGKEPWDLFIQKWHPPDFANHFGAFMIDPAHPLYDPERDDEAWDYWGRVMGAGDRLIATAMECAGGDAIVAIMSDHGGVTTLPRTAHDADVVSVLEDAGLVARGASGGIDWSGTRAFGRGNYVWVSTKGRDPDGIVEPGDEFEEVRQLAINALAAACDPGTGRPYWNLVCRKEDAAMVGIGGGHAGDVFLWAEQAPLPAHGSREELQRRYADVDLGTWEQPRFGSGGHSADPFIVMCGPGLKRGYRRERAVWLNAFAPTLALAWGIPVPADADGAAIWDFLE